MQDSQRHEAWEIAAGLHEEMRIEEGYQSTRFPYLVDTKRWIVATDSDSHPKSDSDSEDIALTIKLETTSLFLARRKSEHPKALPSGIFQSSKQLQKLKENKAEEEEEGEEEEEEKEEDTRMIEFFQRLWVLDICCTDWELTLYPNITEKMATNIREINVKKGRTWHKNQGWTWRHRQNIHKLRVIEPTCPWNTESMDDFVDLVNLELLDLSGNSTIQVLPSLSGATALSTLILDGCVGLEHVDPKALPPSLETFIFDAGGGKDHNREAKIKNISVTGCPRLVNFRLYGSLPNLKELDLSNTSVKTLDLRDKVVQVPCLQQIILLGCQGLRAVLWPKKGMPKLMVLCIDTRGGEAIKPIESHDYLTIKQEEEYRHSSVYATDIRFLQSLMVPSGQGFCWNTAMLNLNICLPCTSKGYLHSNKEKMGPYSTGQLVGSPLHKPLIPKSYRTYSDVKFDKATIDLDGSSAQQFESLDLHVEIGEGINNSNVVTAQGIRAVVFFMNSVNSLLVHDIPSALLSLKT
ncbi:hypothetical protein BAE44_0024186 [Dichanthelium oligosanthes]|uniref:Uncharacterized protein n=1 Tax=Dichanthelium oligosanthes TaxID=888268 RepID=A0A1E5UPL2_9POAL|nr:hypothetical protein BAE44_0024186 [Dichanthelium oligosanthes]